MYYVTNKNISSEFEMLSVGCPNSILAASHSHNQYMRWIDYHPHFENCCLATGDYVCLSIANSQPVNSKTEKVETGLTGSDSLAEFGIDKCGYCKACSLATNYIAHFFEGIRETESLRETLRLMRQMRP